MSGSASVRSAPVVAFGDVILAARQHRTPVHESLKDRRRWMIATVAALRATDANRAMPVEPDRDIDRLNVGLAIDQVERHTHAVGVQITIALGRRLHTPGALPHAGQRTAKTGCL